MGSTGSGVSDCRALGVPGLGPVHCLCGGPGPGLSGGQCHVRGICELGGLRVAFWWVGLVPAQLLVEPEHPNPGAHSCWVGGDWVLRLTS